MTDANSKPKPKPNTPAPTDEVPIPDPNVEERPKTGKDRRKLDPAMAARLQKLENEKELLLTQEKWQDHLKAINVEATQSLAAAEQYEQTKG